MGIAMIETPKGRDGFALGELHGWMACQAHMRDRITSLIEENAGEDDRPNVSFSSGNEDEYQI